MVDFTGGCLCGVIRYKVSGDIIRTANCHCDDCRKATGSAFATNVFVAADDITVTHGTLKSYNHIADSGNAMTKEFCGDCGSQIFGFGAARPGVKNVKAGSIDDASFVKPEVNLFLAHAIPFTKIDREIDCFDGMPK
ncbi:MAG: GFA family protein [Rhodospirillales bacterium]|nr:GFA family protein [Rhodospirillales bacterium]